MTSVSDREMLVRKLQEVALCDAVTAWRAVELFADDPKYVDLDQKIQVMLDWVTAYSFTVPGFNQAMLVDKLQQLAGCAPDIASKAVEIFGDDPSYVNLDNKIEVMLDWVSAYHISTAETKNEEYEENGDSHDLNSRWLTDEEVFLQELGSQQNNIFSEFVEEDSHEFEQWESSPMKKQKMFASFPQGPMTGYGASSSHRKLEEAIAGPPFFYFENVKSMPTGEWDCISSHLYGVQPEFTDSKHSTACSRPRGYIHNLPTEGRKEIISRGPRTIKELIPGCREYWPEWDDRTKLNCITTNRATECVKRKVDRLFELWADKSKPPPAYIKEKVLKLAKKWNLIWIKPDVLVPLEINQVEQAMGYDKGHTVSLYHPNDQMKCLGNSFQVNTVGYHLSVLKALYPRGLKVLSLFAGIGGAEVALQKLGMRLNVVVSVESDEKSRRVIIDWWKSTNQTGELILEYTDVRDLDGEILRKLLAKVGGFDLVVGGSPCSNLSGMNRTSRTGLQGTSSILFFEFPRILGQVRRFMAQKEKKPIIKGGSGKSLH